MAARRGEIRGVPHSDSSTASDRQKLEQDLVATVKELRDVKAALDDSKLGLVDNWLRHVQDVRDEYGARLDLTDPVHSLDRLCELNVVEQALHVCETTVARDAWARGQPLTVHSWIYGLQDGRLRDLRFTAGAAEDVAQAHRTAVAAIAGD